MIGLVIVCIGFTPAYAQLCNCPPASACKPCSGGYTSVTLRYNGDSPGLVVIIDGQSVLANLTLSPGGELTINGSKKNEKFADREVPVLVNGAANTVLGPLCSELKVGSTYGLFTVISAESIGGIVVCCTTPPPDVTAPVISNLPATVYVETTTACSAPATWAEPTASDNCTLKSFTSSHKPGDTFLIGTTTVVYTAIDEAGLSTTASFSVVVSDKKAPVFTGGPAADVVVAAAESCNTAVTWTDPTVVDNCSLQLSQSHKSGDSFAVGKTTVAYEAKDPSGNTAKFAFNVIVEDRTAPAFTSFPENIIAYAGPTCTARVSWKHPSATDVCSAITLVSSHNPDDEFGTGVTVVEYTAADTRGNKISRTFTVTVLDQASPKFVNCPSNMQMTIEEGSRTNVSWIPPTVLASCAEITVQSSHEPNAVFKLGNTPVEYTATSSSGASTSCTFTVSVIQSEKQLEISKLITPDGDGANDEWILANIHVYKSNKVVIFDRWGGVIFQASDYDNHRVVWKGTNQSGTLVPTGTYFYSIIATSEFRRIESSGAIELVR